MTAPKEVDNPWRESLQNCTTGDNYLRTQEYFDLIAELDRLYAIASEVESLRQDAEYYKWRLQEILPLFEEARDAICAIPLASAKLRQIDLSLGDRMDKAGTRKREEWDAARKA